VLESPSGASRRLRVEVVVDYNSTTEALSSEIILAKVLIEAFPSRGHSPT